MQAGLTFDAEQTSAFMVTELLPHFSLLHFLFVVVVFFILRAANEDNSTHGNTDPTTEQK